MIVTCVQGQQRGHPAGNPYVHQQILGEVVLLIGPNTHEHDVIAAAHALPPQLRNDLQLVNVTEHNNNGADPADALIADGNQPLLRDPVPALTALVAPAALPALAAPAALPALAAPAAPDGDARLRALCRTLGRARAAPLNLAAGSCRALDLPAPAVGVPPVPLSTLTRLRHLALPSNALTDAEGETIFNHLDHLTDLTHLDLSGDNFTARGVDALVWRLAAPPPAARFLPALRSLDLSERLPETAPLFASVEAAAGPGALTGLRFVALGGRSLAFRMVRSQPQCRLHITGPCPWPPLPIAHTESRPAPTMSAVADGTASCCDA